MSMGEGIVIVVSGGVVQGVASNMDVDVTLVDWDNIKAGDDAPELPEGMTYAENEVAVVVDQTAPVKRWKWLRF